MVFPGLTRRVGDAFGRGTDAMSHLSTLDPMALFQLTRDMEQMSGNRPAPNIPPGMKDYVPFLEQTEAWSKNIGMTGSAGRKQRGTPGESAGYRGISKPVTGEGYRSPFSRPMGSQASYNTPGSTAGQEASLFSARWGRNKPQIDQDALQSILGGEEMMIVGNPADARGLEGTKRWKPLIQKAARESGVPWQVIAAVMGIESGGDARAGSPAGARGLMQIMPNYWQGTADKYGGNLWDPWTNIRTGADVLKHYYDRYGSWDLAARGYLAGDPYSTARDAHGTGVDDYSRWFNANLAALGYGQTSAQGAQATSGNSVWNITGGKVYGESQGYGHTAYAHSSGGYANNFHDGRDLAIPQGTRLNAGVSGTVVYAGIDGGYGGTVKVRTSSGHIIRLSHLSSINVRPGQTVGAGSMVGLSGGANGTWGAGWSTGPHLHLSVYGPDGRAMDPKDYFNW